MQRHALLVGRAGFGGTLLQALGHPLVERDVEQAAQYLQTRLAVRREEALKLPLRQKDDLAELLDVVAKQFANAFVDDADPLLGQHRSAIVDRDIIDLNIGHIEQIGGVDMVGLAIAAQSRPLLLGLPAHEVSLAAELEQESHLCEGLRGGMACRR